MRKFKRIQAKDFEPHPDDAAAVRLLGGKYKHALYKLTPKGKVWAFTIDHVSDPDAPTFLQLPNLIELNVANLLKRDTGFTPNGFQIICSHPNIQAYQDQNNNRLGDEAASIVGHNKRLRWVHFGGCGITDAGVRSICNATQLLKLSIFDNNITDKCVQDLLNLTNLRRLNVRNTKITIPAMLKLQNELPRCTIDALLPKNTG